MSASQYLGIYTDAIDRFADLCNSILGEAEDILLRLGKDAEIEKLDFDLDEEAVLVLDSKAIDVKNITNSIIDAYMSVATNALTDVEAFAELGVKFDYYANCDDSYLITNYNDMITHHTGDEKLHTVIKEALVENVAAIAGIESDTIIYDDFMDYSFNELAECYTHGKLVGAIADDVRKIGNEEIQIKNEIQFKSKEIMVIDNEFRKIDITGDNLYEAVLRAAKNEPEIQKLVDKFGSVEELMAQDDTGYEVYTSVDDKQPRLAFYEQKIDTGIPLTANEQQEFDTALNTFEKEQDKRRKFFERD